jgi:two-component system, OmpR family, response regulator ChvI
LYRKIRELDSKVRVCFITAFETYFEKFRQEFFPLEEIKGFIKKPIQIENLERFVKAVTK